MAIIPRQTGLLSAENWKKVYQTFKEADFTAYDFETLRKSMIDYIKLNYSEDYNDFTESSEFIALIDLIAFLGQSLAFRTDLNARENFMDTAERRDSVLKLARLISYNPKRTLPASGLLKIDAISTTEVVYDSDGNNLSNSVINWDDTTNENWLEQFNTVINAALVSSQVVGRPGNSQTVNNIRTDEYGINLVPTVVPAFRFSATIEGNSMTFEAVSATTSGRNYIYEQAPDLGKPFNIVYRNDRAGNSSNNTGFFVYFKQGELSAQNFVIEEMVPNKTVDLNINNINNTDVWLYSLDSAGAADELWTAVPATSGINIIYNNYSDRNLYQINSRINDQISLVFGDGAFANIPQGSFRIYYRTSNGLSYRITPDEMRGVQISFDYVNRNGRIETLSMRASLRSTVANASGRESIDEIKQKAPAQYYTQNRMITGEDYNIFPYTNFKDIVRVKSVNRTSSGLSRYLDVLDTTGKYSSTNIFGSDGVLYIDDTNQVLTVKFNDVIDIRKFVFNTLGPDIVASKNIMHYYHHRVRPEVPILPDVKETDLVTGETYTITFVGNTDFTQYGATSNTIGTTFVAENAGNNDKFYNVRNYGITAFEFSGTVIPRNPTLTGRVGDVFTFEIATPGYNFYLKTQRTLGIGSLVTTGSFVGINGTDVGRLVWDTTGVAPGTYYYTNNVNSSMSGQIILTGFGTGLARTYLRWNLSTVGDGVATGFYSYNSEPVSISAQVRNQFKYLRPGALVKYVAQNGYHFNPALNLVPGPATRYDDTEEIYAAIIKVLGDGTNNGQGNFSSGLGPVAVNTKVPSGSVIESIIPALKNSLLDSVEETIITLFTNFNDFGLFYNITTQNWDIIQPGLLSTRYDWYIKFEYNNVTETYLVTYRSHRYIFHSPKETNFFFEDDLFIYDSENNSVVRDSIKILRVNGTPDYINMPYSRDYEWYISESIRRSDGYTENKSVYLTYADSNEDSVPDYPNLFDIVVTGGPVRTTVLGFNADQYAIQVNIVYKSVVGRYPTVTELDRFVGQLVNDQIDINGVEIQLLQTQESRIFLNTGKNSSNLVFFELTSGSDEFEVYQLLDNKKIISNFLNPTDIPPSIRNYDIGQLFYTVTNDQFYTVLLDQYDNKILSEPINPTSGTKQKKYKAMVGRQDLYYQYRHNSPDSNRIDPSISNIIDIYLLTTDYNTSYRNWLADTSNKLVKPVAPTNTELQVRYNDLENFKSVSDTIIFHSAVFKPLFGSKADSRLQAVFRVIKNPALNISDADVKTSLIAAINEYFSSENWDFGETFYFSELSAYLHKTLSPDIASIVIVSKDPNVSFGNLYQINAEPYEIIVSAATVQDVEIVSALTALQLNQNL